MVNSEVKTKLAKIITEQGTAIDNWFTNAFAATPMFFYNSVDIRHSGFKIAPVDTNMFPGGFNNLSKSEIVNATNSATRFFKKYQKSTKKLLLIAEDHTRNKYYLENIAVLLEILNGSGVDTRLTSFEVSASNQPLTLESDSGKKLSYYPVSKDNSLNILKTSDGFIPDLVLVNNDLSSGAPELIQNINQEITPPTGFGWYKRRKTSHFEAYNNIARDFCLQFNLDPWLISTLFHKCGSVNFKTNKGLNCVEKAVDSLIEKIKNKYDQYGIKSTPYVFIKSDKGTYGMGIMTARSGDEVLNLNKKTRNKMSTIKEGSENTEVIVQEGIPTIDEIGGNPAEPMMYLIGGEPISCFYRLNTQKDKFGNLNAKGMQFSALGPDHSDSHCKILGLIAKLASYAAAWECYVESYNI